MKVTVFRHACGYVQAGDWDEKGKIIVTPEMVQHWNPKIKTPTEFKSCDSRTFIEQSPEVLKYWQMCGASLLESLDKLLSVNDADMKVYVEYRALTADDNELIRSWLSP